MENNDNNDEQDNNMKMNNVFICGSVRNCEKYIHSVFLNIKQITNVFNDYHIILSFDISSDNTLELLTQHQKEYGIDKMDILVNQELLPPIRVQRISDSRNRILGRLREMITETSNYWNYFIMMDFDDVCSHQINIKILSHYLTRNDWDCLSFNRSDYYDIWALSFDNYIYSCWSFPNAKKVVEDMKKMITQKLSNMNKYDLYRCYSAFNGFGIYRLDKFINCEYKWIIDLKQFPRKLLELNFELTHTQPLIRVPNLDCEHRSFHFQAIKKNNANIMISPHKLFLE